MKGMRVILHDRLDPSWEIPVEAAEIFTILPMHPGSCFSTQSQGLLFVIESPSEVMKAIQKVANERAHQIRSIDGGEGQ